LATLRHWHALGITMISAGADFNYILTRARDTLKNIRTVQQD
jgi:hypothetical protein